MLVHEDGGFERHVRHEGSNELADTGITCLALSKLSLTLANATFSVSG